MNPVKEEKKYDVGVIVGRFQIPSLHPAHMDLLNTVASAHKKVLIFLGESVIPATKRNPMDFFARKLMLEKAMEELKHNDFAILPLQDNRTDEGWSANLDSQIGVLTKTMSVVLYGGRDSFLPHYKGKYPTVELDSSQYVSMSASQIRAEVANRTIPDEAFRAGMVVAVHNQFHTVHPTVDIAVCRRLKDDTQEVLLARKPGETKYRFIGGFVDPKDDSYEAAAKRELREEAGSIEVGDMVYVTSAKIDDWRYRNEENKIVSTLFMTNFVFGAPSPDDDICELRWVALSEGEKVVIEEHLPFMKALVKRLTPETKMAWGVATVTPETLVQGSDMSPMYNPAGVALPKNPWRNQF